MAPGSSTRPTVAHRPQRDLFMFALLIYGAWLAFCVAWLVR